MGPRFPGDRKHRPKASLRIYLHVRGDWLARDKPNRNQGASPSTLAFSRADSDDWARVQSLRPPARLTSDNVRLSLVGRSGGWGRG